MADINGTEYSDNNSWQPVGFPLLSQVFPQIKWIALNQWFSDKLGFQLPLKFFPQINGTENSDTIYTKAGNDIVDARGGDDQVYGEAGNDALYGGAGNDNLDGGLGNDTLDGGAGDDWLAGGYDPNDYSSDEDYDVLSGGDGNDTLFGNNNDLLYGDAGNDSLGALGSIYNQSMYGGTGDDTYSVDTTADMVTEYLDEGVDTVSSTISYTLGANQENLILGGTAINGYGNSLNNRIIGGYGDDQLFGGEGNDELRSYTGNDSLYGGTGNDTLDGQGEPNLNPERDDIDSLTGEAGHDRFILGNGFRVYYDDGLPFDQGLDNYALITDFTSGEDTIQLKGGVNYQLQDVSLASGISGVGIYVANPFPDVNELIGVVQGSGVTVSSLTINNNSIFSTIT